MLGFLWDREGDVRRVPAEVFENARNVLEAYQTLVQAGRLAELPKDVGFIYWEQTVDVADDT